MQHLAIAHVILARDEQFEATTAARTPSAHFMRVIGTRQADVSSLHEHLELADTNFSRQHSSHFSSAISYPPMERTLWKLIAEEYISAGEYIRAFP